jgi:hypothetical protein
MPANTLTTSQKLTKFFFGTPARAALTVGAASAIAIGATEGAAALGSAAAQKLYNDTEWAILNLFKMAASTTGTRIAAHLVPDLGITAAAMALAAAAKGIYNKATFGFCGINSSEEAAQARDELQSLLPTSVIASRHPLSAALGVNQSATGTTTTETTVVETIVTESAAVPPSAIASARLTPILRS